MPVWAIKPLLYLAGLAAIVWALHAGYSSIYQRGYDAKTLEVTMQRMADERTQAIAALAREAEVRAVEVANDAKMRNVTEAYEKERRDAERETNLVVSSLRSGNIRLQKRFQCEAETTGGKMSNSTLSTSGIDARENSGFTLEDAETALGIAKSGDEAIRQLTACQNAIREYYRVR